MSKAIRTGATYTTRIGRNSVEVKVTGTNEKGWQVTTASGKVLTIKDATRLTPVSAPAESAPVAPTPARRGRSASSTSPAPEVATPPQGAPQATEKRLGLMGAALKVLGEADQADLPMGCKGMVERALAKGYWKPLKGGKTPVNTLAAMILRDLKEHADEAKFRRAEEDRFGRGKFFLRG